MPVKRTLERAEEMDHIEFKESMVPPEQQAANALSYIATQMEQINRKMNLLIEAIERNYSTGA